MPTRTPGLLSSDEPKDGDFASYIESLVGGPPEDPEQAGRELSERLARRSAERRDATRLADEAAEAVIADRAAGRPTPAQAPRRSTAPQGPPDLLVLLRGTASRLLIVGGVVLIGLAILMPRFDTAGPGIIALFAGLLLGNARSRRRAPNHETRR